MTTSCLERHLIEHEPESFWLTAINEYEGHPFYGINEFDPVGVIFKLTTSGFVLAAGRPEVTIRVLLNTTESAFPNTVRYKSAFLPSPSLLMSSAVPALSPANGPTVTIALTPPANVDYILKSSSSSVTFADVMYGHIYIQPTGSDASNPDFRIQVELVKIEWVDPGSGARTTLWDETLQLCGPTITTTSLPDSFRGASYSETIQATGGTTPYTWQILLGGPPPDVTLDPSTGVLSGVIFDAPTSVGVWTFTVRVTDALSATDDQELSITVHSRPEITTTSVPGGTVDIAYSEAVLATGGSTPYAWSIVGGVLPPGLSIGSSSGIISGTPTTVGSFYFTVRVTDALSQTDDQALSITIDLPLSGGPAILADAHGIHASGVGGIGVRVTGEAYLFSSRLDGGLTGFDLQVDTASIAHVMACSYEEENLVGTGVLDPLRGDRGVWDTVNEADRHARDIENVTPVYHNPAATGQMGKAPVSDGTKWVATDITTQAELDAVKDEQFVVMVATADLANERVLTAGNGLTRTDGGAGAAVTLAADYAGVTELADVAAAEAAGSATKLPRGDHVHAHGSGYLPDAHHDKSHSHSGADGSGTVSHSGLTGVTAGQHHAEDHNHAGSPTQRILQANSHESPDTDASAGALHHTLGTGANQAAAGNHVHTGTGNQYRQFVYTVSGGDFQFVKLADGTPVFALQDLE